MDTGEMWRRVQRAEDQKEINALTERVETLKDELIQKLSVICTLQRASERMISACGPCKHDHHGNCQAHFIGNPCVVEELKTALAMSRQ